MFQMFRDLGKYRWFRRSRRQNGRTLPNAPPKPRLPTDYLGVEHLEHLEQSFNFNGLAWNI